MKYDDKIATVRAQLDKILRATKGQIVCFDMIYAQTAFPLGLGERTLRNSLDLYARIGQIEWLDNDHSTIKVLGLPTSLLEQEPTPEEQKKIQEAEAVADDILTAKPEKKK